MTPGTCALADGFSGSKSVRNGCKSLLFRYKYKILGYEIPHVILRGRVQDRIQNTTSNMLSVSCAHAHKRNTIRFYTLHTVRLLQTFQFGATLHARFQYMCFV